MCVYDTISENEWVVMEILWKDGEIKSASITAELEKARAGPAKPFAPF